jgi:FMN reductase
MSGPVSIVALVGNPRVGSRTSLAAEAFVAGIAKLAQEAGVTAETSTIELAALAPELFVYPSEAVDAAVAQAVGATVLVVASPTFKATYTGLLKVFLDRVPSYGLEGVVAVPLMLGGAPNHMLAVDVHLRPVLLEAWATCPTRGLFVQESELERLDEIVGTWCAASRAALLPVLTTARS